MGCCTRRAWDAHAILAACATTHLPPRASEWLAVRPDLASTWRPSSTCASSPISDVAALRAALRRAWRVRVAGTSALLAALVLATFLPQRHLYLHATELLAIVAATTAGALSAVWVCLPRRIAAESLVALPGVGIERGVIMEDGVLRVDDGAWAHVGGGGRVLHARSILGVILYEAFSRCAVYWFVAVLTVHAEEAGAVPPPPVAGRGGEGRGGGAAALPTEGGASEYHQQGREGGTQVEEEGEGYMPWVPPWATKHGAHTASGSGSSDTSSSEGPPRAFHGGVAAHL